MKRSIIYYVAILKVLFLLISCDDSILKPDVEPTHGLNIQIGNSILYTEDDIEYYDHSAHYFYFKKSFRYWLSDYKNSKFWITRDGNVIYEGTLSDNGACYVNNDSLLIYDTFNFPDFVLKLGNIWYHYAGDTSRIDDREDEEFLNELKELDIFYHGLECTVDSIKISDINEVIVSYSITNNDQWGYYFLDPYKITIDHISNLDRCLSFWDYENQKCFYSEPYYDSIWVNDGEWNLAWLTLIEPGGEKNYSTKYQLNSQTDTLSTGIYWIRMVVPGLTSQLDDPEERLLDNGRIWLGEMELFQKITIE